MFNSLDDNRKLQDVLDEITERFDKPDVEYHGKNSWSMTLWDWRVHDACLSYTYNRLESHGESPEEAARLLLDLASMYTVNRGSTCRYGCPKYEEIFY